MTGVSALLSRLAALPPRVQAAAERACLEAARAAADQARQAAPIRTGALRASISAKGRGESAQAIASVPYAGIVESRTPFLSPSAQSADFSARLARALKEGLR